MGRDGRKCYCKSLFGISRWSFVKYRGEEKCKGALRLLLIKIQNPSKTGQNQAQNGKRGKVKSQPKSTKVNKKSTPTKSKLPNQKVKRNKG
uniref:Uncharacterized protein n=1 Tax=Tanacetum cinerariifolium TaxID=118510 RepID=A0A699RVL0_TANCI|nr:hypothetical protein [Tanacetum cinerariifolium]